MTDASTARNISLRVPEGSLTGLSLHNTNTDDEYAGADSRLLPCVRFPEHPSTPVFLTRVVAVDDSGVGQRMRISDPAASCTGTLDLVRTDDGLRLSLQVEANRPLWCVEWTLEGLRLDCAIVPALGGVVLDRSFPRYRQFVAKHPFWWRARYAIFSYRSGGWDLRVEGEEQQFATLRIGRGDRGWTVGVGIETTAPLTRTSFTATCHLRGFVGPWTEAAATYKRRSFPRTAVRHAATPRWREQIRLVLELWGASGKQPDPLHTFAQMQRRIELFATLFPPQHTLLYLPGFAEQGLDTNMPSYEPSALLGGQEGLRRLTDRAHTLGYRVMLHTNCLGVDAGHAAFAELRDAQVHDPFGRAMGWALDLDGDWSPEPFFPYIHPGSLTWQKLYSDTVARLVEETAVDAIFMDQTVLAFNDGRYGGYLAGLRAHLMRMHQRLPTTLIGGEGISDVTADLLDVAQVHGLDGRPPWIGVHPIEAYLFADQALFVGHLLTMPPASRDFLRQERVYEQLGVVPVVALWRHDQPLRCRGTSLAVQRATLALRQGLTPAPDLLGEVSAAFAYRAADGAPVFFFVQPARSNSSLSWPRLTKAVGLDSAWRAEMQPGHAYPVPCRYVKVIEHGTSRP